jgi:hypothetical protein
MQHRRQLIEGLAKALPEIDANAAAQFIAGDNAVSAKPVATTPDRTLRTPLTTRLRKDIGDALKRASLERQLRGESPSAVQDILDEALLPWLQDRGYLP